MTTSNAASALGLADRLGKIAVGYDADLAVYAGDASKPYDAVLSATPKDMLLVMVGGALLYVDASLAAATAQPPREALDVCGSSKLLCIAISDAANKLGQA